MRLPALNSLTIAVLLTAAPSPSAAQTSRSDHNLEDSVVASASRAIAEGRPWQATRLLAGLVKEPNRRTAPTLLTAARAAARWEGWSSVIRYLHDAPWLDRTADGLGQALLGRALLERGQADVAIEHTRRAAAVATGPDKGARLVIHARAFDRTGRLDSAAANYLAAARLQPKLRDWLLLRAAGVTADSTVRQALFGKIENPVAAGRTLWTDALARDRVGDWQGAARQYASVGARVASIRQLLEGDSAARQLGRAELVQVLAPEVGVEDVGEAIALFDREVPRKTPTEELKVARRAAAVNLLERAARGYAAAGKSLLTDRDRFSYATVLARLGRSADALLLFDAVKAEDLKGEAAYQRARLKLRSGRSDEAVDALARIPVAFPTDSIPAASSLFLRADLLADRQSDDSARALFVEAAEKYPTTGFGQRAALQAAMIAYVNQDYAVARTEFARIAERPNQSEAVAATYWSGRVAEAMGDTAAARLHYQATVARSKDGYYAVRASRRLGERLWAWEPVDPAPADSQPLPLRRARALLEVGMRVEARLELDAYIAEAGLLPEAQIKAAENLAAGRWYSLGMRLAQRARGPLLDRNLALLIYPLPFRDLLLSEARASRVAPNLAAGVIRQESAFDPEARSTADARGLMQVLPSVGAELVRAFGIDWDPVLLYQPDVNLDFGVRHLAFDLAKLEWPERALAAYNAGLERVARWQEIRGVDVDPEVFVERIPFTETRDYVRRVLANAAMYAALYSDLTR